MQSCTVVRKEQKDETMQEGTGKQHAKVGKGEEYTSLTGVVWKGEGVQRVLVRKGQIFLS